MWRFAIRSSHDGFDEEIFLDIDNRMEVSPIIWWPFWENEIKDEDLLWKFYDPFATKCSSISWLTTEEFRMIYAATRKAYDNFKAGVPPINGPYPMSDDPEMTAARHKWFDLYMGLLASDPRLIDPPQVYPRPPVETNENTEV